MFRRKNQSRHLVLLPTHFHFTIVPKGFPLFRQKYLPILSKGFADLVRFIFTHANILAPAADVFELLKFFLLIFNSTLLSWLNFFPIAISNQQAVIVVIIIIIVIFTVIVVIIIVIHIIIIISIHFSLQNQKLI